MALPTTMRALVLESFVTDSVQLSVKEVPMPVPQPGQVLIRMEAAPINPSDMAFLRGMYDGVQLPIIPGNEGSGTVIASGGGIMAWRLQGKRVACARKLDGCWAEYMVTDALYCVPLGNQVTFQQGSCFFVNPMTIVMFDDVISAGKHRAIISTAAASALGKMLIKWYANSNVEIINVVRRAEQMETLQELGAKYVLNSQDPDFESQLQNLSHELGATCALDAIAGEMTGLLLRNMPSKSVVYVYGALSFSQCTDIDPRDFISRSKKVEGLFLANYLQQISVFKTLRLISKVSSRLDNMFATEVAREVPLDEFNEAYAAYASNMSQGKTLIRPHLTRETVTPN